MEVLAKFIKTNFNKIIIFGIGGSLGQNLCMMFFQIKKYKLILLQAVTQQNLKSSKFRFI